jgi:predicted O-methyltransferase YrrM
MEHFYQNIYGWSRPESQGELLDIILKKISLSDKIKIAEIGVFLGRGTALWNVELINKGINYDYYAIDHFLGSSEHEKNVDYYGQSLKNLSPILNKIKLIKNDSLSESQNYSDEFFDVVYIDASHEYEYVKNDIISWYPKIKKGGIICGDDYHKDWPGVIMAVNEIFDTKFEVCGENQWWLIK